MRAENSTEVALIAKAHVHADVRKRTIRLYKQRLGALDAMLAEILHERQSRNPLEEGHEMRFAHAAHSCCVTDLNPAAAVFAQVPEYGAEALDSALLLLECFDRSQIT